MNYSLDTLEKIRGENEAADMRRNYEVRGQRIRALSSHRVPPTPAHLEELLDQRVACRQEPWRHAAVQVAQGKVCRRCRCRCRYLRRCR